MLPAMGQVATDAHDDPEVIATSLRLLAEAPVRIERATAGVDEARLHRRTADEPFCPSTTSSPMSARPRNVRERFIDAMSTGDHATLRYVSPRSELRTTDYVDRTFAENLAAFRTSRAGLLDRLAGLPADGRTGSLIRDRPETVASYLRYLTEHETAHCEQIEALLR